MTAKLASSVRAITGSVTLVSEQGGQWATSDGRYRIERDSNERECECATCQAGYTDETATYYAWIVWDVALGDYAAGTDQMEFERFGDALAYLRARYSEESS